MTWLRSAGKACHWCLCGLGTLVLWCLWLALALLLALQLHIAISNQLAVPPFILRAIEEKLAASGMTPTFGATRFDPSGRILIEKVAITLPDFSEPVITARAVFIRLDPWALAIDRIEPLEVRATGVDWRIPAVLSPSGKTEDALRDFDLAIRPLGDDVVIEYANCWIGKAAVAVRGVLHLPASPGQPAPLPSLIAHNYSTFCRQVAPKLLQLGTLEQPFVQAVLIPSEAGFAEARVLVTSPRFTWKRPLPIDAEGVRVTARLPLGSEASERAEAEAFCSRLTVGPASARDARMRLVGALAPHATAFEPRSLDVSADELNAVGVAAESPFISLVPAPNANWRGEARAWIYGAPLAVNATVDPRTKSADAQFSGAISPGWIDPIGRHFHRDLGAVLGLGQAVAVEGSARIDPGWRFRRASATIAAQEIRAGRVMIDEARGRVEFDGRWLKAPEAFARLGTSFARGSYEEELATRRYRFLLEGRLRPLEIAGWFPKWWREFFGHFDFSAEAPLGNVDVRGRIGTGRETAVFVFADSDKPIITGVPWDRVITRIFVRPFFDDGLEVAIEKNPGAAHGTFQRQFDRQGQWQHYVFNVSSSLDLTDAPKMFGPNEAGAFTPFAFSQPPSVKARGDLLFGAHPPGGSRDAMQIEVRSGGPLRFYGFPLDRAAFHAAVDNDAIAVDHLDFGFAGGDATGHAHVSGRGQAREVVLDCAVRNAHLVSAIAAFEDFSHRGAPGPPPSLGKYVEAKSNILLDLDAAARGHPGVSDSFQGDGSAQLRGPELVKLPLLGFLSHLLTFTSLRFTTADAKFHLENGRLAFPSINVKGANSAIEATGYYGIARHQLDFNAKVYPFGRSSSFLERGLNLAVMPFSSVMEMRLTGDIDQPKWSIVPFAFGFGGPPRTGEEAKPPAPLR
jgi:hypothetical protein